MQAETSHRDFELWTGNLLLGNFTWATIALPEGWTVKRGGTPPDISYTKMIGKSGWVQEGEARYYLVSLISGEGLEMEIRCKRASPATHPQHPDATTVSVAGHLAKISIETVPFGLLKKKTLRQMRLTVPCHVTDRTIEVSIVGSPENRNFDEIVGLVGSYKCH